VTARTDTLRSLLDGPEMFIAADANSVLTARIAERLGFPAIYVGGHSLGVLHYGVPDYGVLEPHEMIEQAGRIARSVGIPTVVDADEIGGNVASIGRGVREYGIAGIAGLHMEDDQEPKHSTYRGPLLSIEDMQARIAVAVEVRTDSNFIIVARTNELLNRAAFGDGTLEEAVRRAHAYAEAGADSFVAPGILPEEVPSLVKGLSIPYAAFGTPPEPDGTKMVLSTGWATSAASKNYDYVAKEYMRTGEVPPDAAGRADDIDGLLREPDYDAIVRTWAERSGRRTGPSLHQAPG
jgi:2-methylisocitrate lyase-like PEP mutase family enzyme